MNIQGKAWGFTKPIFNKNNVEIHDLFIHKGGYCSKHKHNSKFNKFIVKKGVLKVSIWKNYGADVLEDVTILTENSECTVPPGDFHSFEALEDTEALEIYWVELRTDDIERTNHGGRKNPLQTPRFEQVAQSAKRNHSEYLV